MEQLTSSLDKEKLHYFLLWFGFGMWALEMVSSKDLEKLNLSPHFDPFVCQTGSFQLEPVSGQRIGMHSMGSLCHLTLPTENLMLKKT